MMTRRGEIAVGRPDDEGIAFALVSHFGAIVDEPYATEALESVALRVHVIEIPCPCHPNVRGEAPMAIGGWVPQSSDPIRLG